VLLVQLSRRTAQFALWLLRGVARVFVARVLMSLFVRSSRIHSTIPTFRRGSRWRCALEHKCAKSAVVLHLVALLLWACRYFTTTTRLASCNCVESAESSRCAALWFV
jgi:hypothetical protein